MSFMTSGAAHGMKPVSPLAKRSPCDPRTLARAARDNVATQPAFAIEAGLLAQQEIVAGRGYCRRPAATRRIYRSAGVCGGSEAVFECGECSTLLW